MPITSAQWLLHSGIQQPDGGVARFYRSDLRSYAPVSTEITGYHASALIYLYHVTERQEFLDRAIATAQFLTRRAWNADLRIFPFEYPQESPAYFFDCGIIIRGLLAVWRVTRESEFLDVALACGDGMLRAFDAGAEFEPVLELPSKRPALRDERWSRAPGCYQLKVALGWHELAEESGETRFHDAYERMLAQALASQAGFLPGHGDPAKVMDRLHAYCYFLEGLLPSLPQAALAEGIRRVEAYLWEIAPVFVRSDVYAQLLRVRLYAGETAELERAALAEFHVVSDDPRIAGGFYFGRNASGFLPYVNPVSTAFAMQALQMAQGPLPDRRLLI